MPSSEMPGAEFHLASLAIAFATGLIFAVAFQKTAKIIECRQACKKGACFGTASFFITTLPVTGAMLLNLAIPIALAASWAVQGLVVNVLGGIAMAKLDD